MAKQAEIIKRILQSIGVVGTGEGVSAEDGSKTLTIALSVQDELSRKQIVWWPDLNCVPTEAENAYVGVIGGYCIDEFGLIGEDAARAERSHDKGLDTLNELGKNIPNGETVEAEYF